MFSGVLASNPGTHLTEKMVVKQYKADGHMVRNVVLFSVLVYELVGPTLTKLALTAAGEIIPEGRTSARTANKPEVPVSLD